MSLPGVTSRPADGLQPIHMRGKLEGFLYLLIRDHLPAGVIEKLVRDCELSEDSLYSNQFLAGYAETLARRLQPEERSTT